MTVGTNGQIPYADSGETTGIRWDDPPTGVDDAADVNFDATGLIHTDAADVQEAIEDHDAALESMQDDIDALAGGGAALVASDLIFDAKGDLPVGTANNAAAKLTVGANGEVLIADSAEVTGLRWGAANDLVEQATAPTAIHGRRWHDTDLGIIFTYSTALTAWVEL